MVMDDLGKLAAQSVRDFPEAGQSFAHFVVSVVGAADSMPAWGQNPVTRDRMLRELVPNESWLASTVSSLSARNAAFSWTLEGPERTCSAIQDALHLSDFGKGWTHLIEKGSTDLYTQDNGWFMEVIRNAQGAFMGLGHLDAARCMRTGNVEIPVIYTDMKGAPHKMAWYQVIDLTDFPSPIEAMNGMQMCAVSRVLRIAQILNDVAIRKSEKLTGRFAGTRNIVSGITMQHIEDAMKKAEDESDNKGRFRYQPPHLIGTVDPTAKIEHVTIPLADIPEGYSEEEANKWYIALLALAFQCEYQDLAPLPGGNLGTSQQSQILHLKAKGKGPELFQKMLEHALNFRVLPRNVTFKFMERDYEAEGVEAGVRKQRAETRQLDIESGTLTPQIARQMMEDEGELSHEYLEMLNEGDVTPEETITDEERLRQSLDTGILPDDEGGKARQDPELAKLEEEYEQEVFRVFQDIGDRIKKRVRTEVRRGS